MSDHLTILLFLVLMGALGWAAARCYYLRVMHEALMDQHRVHELCEDACYRAGLQRGREERGVTDMEETRWREGFEAGACAGRLEERKRMQVGMGAS